MVMALPADLEKDWRYGIMTLLEDLSADSAYLYRLENNRLRLLGRGRDAIEIPLSLDPDEPTLRQILESPFPFSNSKSMFGSAFSSFHYPYLCASSLYFEGQPLGLLVVGKSQSFSQVELAAFSSRALHFALLLSIQKLREEKRQSEKQCRLLEQKVTAANQRLLETDKFASLGHFAGGLAHELNTPLASIQAFTELLELSIKEPNQKESIEGILKSVGHCRDLVLNVLHLSKKQKDDFDAIPLHRVIEDAILLTGSELEKCGIDLETRFQAKPNVRGNHTRLVQVLTNLIMNAKDALSRDRLVPRKGFIKIMLTADHQTAQIAVIDNGPGISKTILGHLFDPFFSTKEVGGGLGLGLSISRTIVETHQGTLELLSDENEGAKALVTLPRFLRVSKPQSPRPSPIGNAGDYASEQVERAGDALQMG